jgi:hypothetical protein
MMLLLLFSLISITFAQQYLSNEFYLDNTCQKITWVFYSYDNTEICDTPEVLNKCDSLNMVNESDIISSKMSCSNNTPYNNTKLLFKNTDFIYINILDNNCTKELGAFAIILNKCVALMSSNTFFKITKSSNKFSSKSYSDKECTKELSRNNTEANPVDLNSCADKLTIYTKDGKYNASFENPNIVDSSSYRQTMSLILLFIIQLILFSL